MPVNRLQRFWNRPVASASQEMETAKFWRDACTDVAELRSADAKWYRSVVLGLMVACVVCGVVGFVVGRLI